MIKSTGTVTQTYIPDTYINILDGALLPIITKDRLEIYIVSGDGKALSIDLADGTVETYTYQSPATETILRLIDFDYLGNGKARILATTAERDKVYIEKIEIDAVEKKITPLRQTKVALPQNTQINTQQLTLLTPRTILAVDTENGMTIKIPITTASPIITKTKNIETTARYGIHTYDDVYLWITVRDEHTLPAIYKPDRSKIVQPPYPIKLARPSTRIGHYYTTSTQHIVPVTDTESATVYIYEHNGKQQAIVNLDIAGLEQPRLQAGLYITHIDETIHLIYILTDGYPQSRTATLCYTEIVPEENKTANSKILIDIGQDIQNIKTTLGHYTSDWSTRPVKIGHTLYIAETHREKNKTKLTIYSIELEKPPTNTETWTIY